MKTGCAETSRNDSPQLSFMSPPSAPYRRASRPPRRTAVELAQLVLRFVDRPLPRGRQVPAGAILVEGEHGHRGPERSRLEVRALLHGPLQRARDLPRATPEDLGFQVHRMAVLGDMRRPAAAAARALPRGCSLRRPTVSSPPHR